MDPHTGVLPGLKVMVDRATRWKLAWQQSPLAASPQEVKDGVEDGTKVGGARVARPVAPPAEPGQPRPTPRRSGRCRRIECSSYGPFGPDQRFFKTDVNFSNTLLERALRHELLRLGTTTIAARVHIGSGNWITVGNDRPRLSRGAETEIAYSIEIVLRGIRLKEFKDF